MRNRQVVRNGELKPTKPMLTEKRHFYVLGVGAGMSRPKQR